MKKTVIYGIFGIAFAKFYLDMTQKDKMQFQDFLNNLSMFTRGILGQLWMTLWIFLWSLLFFIPGKPWKS